MVGYYHCGIIAPLNKDIFLSDYDKNMPLDFRMVKRFFYENKLFEYIVAEGFESNNPCELNFYSELGEKGRPYLLLLKEYINTYTSLKILTSPHSFDVVPKWTSKADLCRYLEYKYDFCQSEILTIGDCGAEGESDYELLCREPSLSVNTVSNALNSCWKFSELDCCNLNATWFYFKSIIFDEQNIFRIFQK